MKKRALIFLAISLVVGGVMLYYKMRDEGFITSLYPVDSNRALIVIRANYSNKPSKGWLSLVHRKDGILWTKGLPAPTESVAAYNGTTVKKGIVTLRYVLDRFGDTPKQYRVAFAVKTGKKLWQTKPVLWHSWESKRVGRIGVNNSLYTMQMADGDQLFDFYGIGRPKGKFALHDTLILKALDYKTGRLLWSQNLGKDILRKPILTKQYLLVQKGFTWTILSRKSGKEVGTFHSWGIPCLSPKSLWFFDKRQKKLMNISLVGKYRQHAYPKVESLNLKTMGQGLSCGFYKDELLFLRQGNALEEGIFILSFSMSDGAMRWRKELSSWKIQKIHALEERYPLHHPFSGRLSRYIPLIVAKLKRRHRLVVLDLDRRELKKEGKETHDLLYHKIFRAGNYYYLHRSVGGLFAISAKTGTIVGAKFFRKGLLESVQPFHIYNDRLWLYSSSWKPFGSLPFFILKAGTLAKLKTAESHSWIKVIDASTYTKSILGW